MEDEIIRLLKRKNVFDMSFNEILSNLEIDNDILEERLEELEKNGTIYKNKRGRFSLISKTSLKKGIVKITKRKGAIVVLEDGEYDLNFDHKNIVSNNDLVLVEPHYNSGRATVVKVLTKEKAKNYIGVITRNNKHFVIRSDDHEDITYHGKYPEGTNVLVDSSTGDIIEVLEDSYELKIKKLYAEEDFPTTFSHEYLEELKSIPRSLSEEDIINAKKNGIYDRRNINIVTIDSEDTKDFDDAVFCDNGLLIISIADLNSIIKEGSVIEKEAIARGTSVYPPGLVNHMFHTDISNGICSLNPNQDRFVNSIVFKIDEKCNITSYHFEKDIIRSREKLTYENVNQYLENNNVVDGYDKYTNMLDSLYRIAMKVKKNMVENGFLSFTSTEVKFIFDNDKKLNIKKRHNGKAEELIEFLMLLHNITKTNYMVEHKLPFIARNHDLPNNDKINRWVGLLSQRGYNVEKKGSYNNEDIKRLLNTYIGKDEQLVLDSIAIRGQAKARFSAFFKGHFALGIKSAYATFSSPIRRLSDYVNNRVLEDALKYGDKYAIAKWEPRMEMLAKICTDMEVKGERIERKADDLKKIEYMKSVAIGSKFAGIISEVGRGFIKVLLSNMVYGKVYISAREYELSKDGYSLINKINGERILVGDSIDVSLNKIDEDNNEILLLRNSYGKENRYEKEKKKTKVRKR